MTPISSVASPTSENPLIVDLPDGQKLVVGKLADGSIIEIATWRGTGRPDSRTSRLMLGMANGQATQKIQGEHVASNPGVAKTPQELINQAKGSISGLISRFSGEKITQAEAIVQSEFSESIPDSGTDNYGHIREAGAHYLDQVVRQRKYLRRKRRILKDPVAREIDDWLQSVLSKPASKKSKKKASAKKKPSRKKVAKKASSQRGKRTVKKSSAKKRTSTSTNSRKR